MTLERKVQLGLVCFLSGFIAALALNVTWHEEGLKNMQARYDTQLLQAYAHGPQVTLLPPPAM